MTKKKEVDCWRNSVMCESDLPPNARYVGLWLSFYMDWDTLDNARPGSDRLAAETGLHITTVKRQLKVLRDRGWIVATSKGGTTKDLVRHATIYRGAYPSHGATGHGDDQSHHAREPVAQNASSGSTERANPSQHATVPSHDPVKDRGHDRRAPNGGARSRRLARAGPARSRNNVGTFNARDAGVFDQSGQPLDRRSTS